MFTTPNYCCCLPCKIKWSKLHIFYGLALAFRCTWQKYVNNLPEVVINVVTKDALGLWALTSGLPANGLTIVPQCHKSFCIAVNRNIKSCSVAFQATLPRSQCWWGWTRHLQRPWDPASRPPQAGRRLLGCGTWYWRSCRYVQVTLILILIPEIFPRNSSSSNLQKLITKLLCVMLISLCYLDLFHIFLWWQQCWQMVSKSCRWAAKSLLCEPRHRLNSLDALFLLLQHHPSGTLYQLTLDCESISTFKRHLKTHLFRLTYSSCAASASVSSDLKALYKCVVTGRICRRQLCRYCFCSRANFGVFRPAGATRWTDPGQIWQGGADLIGPGVGVYGWKKLEFYQYNCP